MSRYDASQLKTMLEGAAPLQSLTGGGGVIAAGMAELGANDSAPQMQMPTPAAAWSPVLKGPEA